MAQKTEQVSIIGKPCFSPSLFFFRMHPGPKFTPVGGGNGSIFSLLQPKKEEASTQIHYSRYCRASELSQSALPSQRR